MEILLPCTTSIYLESPNRTLCTVGILSKDDDACKSAGEYFCQVFCSVSKSLLTLRFILTQLPIYMSE